MSSGVGRGRGWLNLKTNKTVSNQKAGNLTASLVMQVTPTNVTVKEESQFSDSSDDVTNLVNKIMELNFNDDGILFNQKVKHIVKDWKNEYHTSEDVDKSFDKLYMAALNDSELASKLVLLLSARSFSNQEIHECKIRNLFLKNLQNTIEAGGSIRKSNRISFQNSIRLLGEYYNKARLSNGTPLNCMAAPIISCLDLLLEDADIQDLKLFTSQLYLNGSAIKAKEPEKFTKLLDNVRALLVSEKKLSKEAKLWILLALEVTNNRFGPLTSEITKFYEEHLGATALVTHGILSVQTNQENKILDNFQSNVNILQVSTGFEPVANDSVSETKNTSQSHNNSSGYISNNSSSQNSRKSRPEPAKKSSNTGRPILGAGARLSKQKNNDESNKANWRDGASTSWSSVKKNSKPNQGWEHDDRFQTDYS